MEKVYTIKELSNILKIPESTLRYYRDRFEEFIPTLGKGRKRRYKKEAIEIFRLIIEGYEQDLTSRQIKTQLINKLSNSQKLYESNEDLVNKILNKQMEMIQLLKSDLDLKKDIEKELNELKVKIKKIEKVLIHFIEDYKNVKNELLRDPNKNSIDLKEN